MARALMAASCAHDGSVRKYTSEIQRLVRYRRGEHGAHAPLAPRFTWSMSICLWSFLARTRPQPSGAMTHTSSDSSCSGGRRGTGRMLAEARDKVLSSRANGRALIIGMDRCADRASSPSKTKTAWVGCASAHDRRSAHTTKAHAASSWRVT